MAEEKQKTDKIEENKTEEIKPVETPKEKIEFNEETISKEGNDSENKTEEKKELGQENKKPGTKQDKKTESKIKKVPKKEAVVNSNNAHLSMKTSKAVCKFIVGKTIDRAVADLQEVAAGKKAVPMTGEIPHRKGKIMSGRFPKNASEHFIKLLKALAGNANVNGLEEPVIAEAIANIGSRPYGKFGSVRRKRAHIKIIAKNRKEWKKSRSKKAKMNKVKSNKKSAKNNKSNSNKSKEKK